MANLSLQPLKALSLQVNKNSFRTYLPGPKCKAQNSLGRVGSILHRFCFCFVFLFVFIFAKDFAEVRHGYDLGAGRQSRYFQEENMC